MVYPERVAGLAISSAGAYTLPAASIGEGANALDARFPYGVSNFSDVFDVAFDADAFARVPVWIGVGERDNIDADVPREWDPYLGRNRRERADKYAASLSRSGSQALLQIIPGVAHEETSEIRAAAIRFLQDKT